MNKIPTANEYLNSKNIHVFNGKDGFHEKNFNIIKNLLIEFAKLYVEESKQETLEETAEKIFSDCGKPLKKIAQKGFIEGVKWQQERSYSEEEVVQIILDLRFKIEFDSTREDIKKWFEKIKKK